MEYLEGFSMTPQSLHSNLCFWLDASCNRQHNLLTYALFLKKQRGYQLELSLSLSLCQTGGVDAVTLHTIMGTVQIFGNNSKK
jgi:hypothetical protein